MTTYTDHQQRQLDQQSGADLDRHVQQHSTGEYIEQYVKLRDKKKSIEDQCDKDKKPYTIAMAQIENYLLEEMNRNDLDSLRAVGVGIAYKSRLMQCKLEDRAALVRHVMSDPAAFEIFTNSLSKEFVRTFVEENNAPPPGVAVTYITNVNVRKD